MNTMQIKCFLAVTETLNFTKAAAQLYISQPGLSKQIVSLERELNTVLFIRDKQKVRLTPAASVLAQELSKLEKKLNTIIEDVQKIGQGYNGTLTIGVLNGQWFGEYFSNTIIHFINDNPNINLSLKQGSYSDLRNWLETEEIDIAITLIMDVIKEDTIQWKKFQHDTAVYAISKNLPLAKKKKITWDDLKNETFIAISPEDSLACYEVCKRGFQKNGFSGPIKYAPNLATVMMLIEAGQGFGIVNHNSSISMNPSIRLISEIQLGGGNIDTASCCMAWKKKNINPSIPLFTNYNSTSLNDG